MHVMILPYLEMTTLFKQFDFRYRATWGPCNNNNIATKTVVSAFLCPSDPGKVSSVGGGVNYRGSAGPTFFYGLATNDQVGMVNFSREVRFNDVTDGTSNVILVGETIIPNETGSEFARRAQTWHADFDSTARFPSLDVAAIGSACDANFGAPGTTDKMLNRDSVGCVAPGGTCGHTVFREEGTMWSVGSGLSTIFSTILNPNTPHSNCMDHASSNLANAPSVVSARSWHSGGVQVTLVDGSVHFISDNIDNTLWQRLGARADGNVAFLP
jgi:hypothetical protein